MLFYSSTNECNTGVPTSFAHESKNLKISQKGQKIYFHSSINAEISLQFDEKIQNY